MRIGHRRITLRPAGVVRIRSTRGVVPGNQYRSDELLIIGAGGHGKVVADAAQAAGFRIIGFVDDHVKEPPLTGTKLLGTISDIPALLDAFPGAKIFVAIGDNAMRMRVSQSIETMGAVFATIVHPSAVVSRQASVSAGTVLMAGVVVNAGSLVGEHVILNTSSSVDHDCRIGAFAHLSPGVHLAGGVMIGEGAHLGVGASVIPGCRVGEWSLVGAGGVVVKDIPPRVVAYGVPARPVRSLGPQ